MGEDSLENKIFAHEKQMGGAQGDTEQMQRIFDVICENLIKSCRDDQTRKSMVEEVLAKMWLALEIIAETHTHNMPHMRDFLMKYFAKNHEKVEKSMKKIR